MAHVSNTRVAHERDSRATQEIYESHKRDTRVAHERDTRDAILEGAQDTRD